MNLPNPDSSYQTISQDLRASNRRLWLLAVLQIVLFAWNLEGVIFAIVDERWSWWFGAFAFCVIVFNLGLACLLLRRYTHHNRALKSIYLMRDAEQRGQFTAVAHHFDQAMAALDN